MKDKKWLFFNELYTPTRKTKAFEVRNKNRILLGIIEWESPWRQYTFKPEDNTEFSSGCLREIANFIDDSMFMRGKNL